MIYRKCIICGCSLDPGEGNMCEECRDEQYMKQQQEKAVRYMVLAKDLSVLLENLGIENGNLILASDGNIYGTFVIDTNEFTVSITEDGKRESVTYAN